MSNLDFTKIEEYKMESKTITINLGDADAEDVRDIIDQALNDEGYETDVSEDGASITIKPETESDSNDDE